MERVNAVGFHFSLQVWPQWHAWKDCIQRRLSMLGRDPELHSKFVPRCRRVWFGGTVDWRLRSGSLCYTATGDDYSTVSAVHPGRVDRAMTFSFGRVAANVDTIDEAALDLEVNAWAFGFVADPHTEPPGPAETIAKVNVWDAFAHVVQIESMDAVPPAIRSSMYSSWFAAVPCAPEMKFRRDIVDGEGPNTWVFENELVSYSMTVQLMVPA